MGFTAGWCDGGGGGGRCLSDPLPGEFHGDLRALAAGAGLEVVRIDLIEGRPEYLRFSAPTYLLGWLYERMVNRVPGLAWLRVLLVVELRKPGLERAGALATSTSGW